MSGNICRCGAYPNIVPRSSSPPKRLAAVGVIPCIPLIIRLKIRGGGHRCRQTKTAQQGADVRFLAGGTTCST